MREYYFESKQSVKKWLSDITEISQQKKYKNWEEFSDFSVELIWRFYMPERCISELQMDNILSREDDSEINQDEEK
jgi:hypothetical protein